MSMHHYSDVYDKVNSEFFRFFLYLNYEFNKTGTEGIEPSHVSSKG